ncbi:uncharacterized protein V1518DRAFT_411642 [Limtongia smithiae]|uniref:uncharacterized protein n=1 Tax=Limtongia smithiae TaxID=1125753 RepID=UPI0034CFAA50
MEASCGPSTPLGALLKHTATDRPVQDRFATAGASSSSQHQDFKTHERQNQLVDDGYRAFLGDDARMSVEFAHMSISEHEQLQQLRQQEKYNSQKSVFDFQADTTSGPVPQSLQSQSNPSAEHLESWHNDFMTFMNSSMPRAHVAQVSANLSYGGMPQTSNEIMYSAFPRSAVAPIGSAYQPVDRLQLSSELIQEEHERQQLAFKNAFDMVETEDLSQVTERTHTLEQEVGDEEERKSKEEESRLATIAGELAASLDQNQSQKFKDSTFLALMRRLRDKEVVVQGNKMIEAVSNNVMGSNEQFATTTSDGSLTENNTEFGDLSALGSNMHIANDADKQELDAMDVGGEYTPFETASKLTSSSSGTNCKPFNFRRGGWEESF